MIPFTLQQIAASAAAHPEIADELRMRVPALVKAQHLSSDGLYATADELQLYTNLNKNECFVFKAPLTSAGP